MDDVLQDLENELKALRPCRPSVLLRARLEHELSQPAVVATPDRAQPVARRDTTATTLRSWKWLSWQNVGAVAAMVFFVSFGIWNWSSAPSPGFPTTEPAENRPVEPSAASVPETPGVAAERLLAATPPRDAYQPVKASNVLYSLADEGPLLLDDNTQARRVRARYVDTYTWKNPATNASLKWSVPRDEVRVLPARFH